MNIEVIDKQYVPDNSRNKNKGINFQIVINLRKASPCMTLQAIGNKCGGISRERVRQILKQAELKTAHYKIPKAHPCLKCGKITTNKLFCCLKCFKEYHNISVICSGCGKLFKLSMSDLIARVNRHIKQEELYCSTKCYGKYVLSKSPRVNAKILSNLSKIIELNVKDLK
jgi:transcription elongation factor Elf1